VSAPRTHPFFFSTARSGRRFFQAQNSPRDEAPPGMPLLDVILLLRRRAVSCCRIIVVGSAGASDQVKKIRHK